MGYSEHLKNAKYYLEEARKLLERGDPYDAAEEAWAAVKHATIALTMAFLNEATPPKGVSWRVFVKEAFVKAGLSEDEASRWASYYIDVRDRLHGGCFYGLTYEEVEHRPLMDRAREYVDLIEKLLKQRQGE
ncbi:MAG: PaREP1 family protein [Caldivirga sp.]